MYCVLYGKYWSMTAPFVLNEHESGIMEENIGVMFSSKKLQDKIMREGSRWSECASLLTQVFMKSQESQMRLQMKLFQAYESAQNKLKTGNILSFPKCLHRSVA